MDVSDVLPDGFQCTTKTRKRIGKSITLEEIEYEFQKGMILKAVDEDDAVIGSVRAYLENGTVYIGKLMVHPEK